MSTATAPTPETTVVHVGGLHYASEKTVVEHALGGRPGVVAVEANPVAQTATVTYDPEQTSVAELQQWVRECGFHCAGQSVPGYVCDPMTEAHEPMAHDHAATERAEHAHGHGHGGHAGMSMEAMERDMRNRFLAALVFTIPIVLWSTVGTKLLGSELATPFGIDQDSWQLLLSLPVVLYASSSFFTGAVAALRNRTLDMMVLVAVAIGVGWLYSVAATFFIEGEVFYEAAGMLATFVLLGHWFEMRARGGANDAIRALLDLAPPKAIVLGDGEPVEVPTAEVQVGDRLLIRPGSKVPVDAIVEEGESQVDESTVTGESLPVKKAAGDELIGATINKNGTLRARATKVGSDTALAQIVKLVQEAQNSKAPGQRLADRAAFWLVLVALIGGGLTFAVWYFIVGRDVQEALLFAITVIVITCPDALGLATPTAIMVGTGLGAQRGILFKHAMALEQAATLDTVVLDKTGTLTRGEPDVVAVASADGVDDNEVLRLVAAAEGDSEHPLAQAIVKAASKRRLTVPRADAFEAVPGHGLLATVASRRLAVGNARLLEREASPVMAWRQGWPNSPDRDARSSRWPSTGAPPPSSPSPTLRARPPPRPPPGSRSSACDRSCCPATAARPPSGSLPSSASTRLSPRSLPPTRPPRSASFSTARPPARSRWSATASTTPRHSRRPTSASPSAPAPTSPSKPPTSCSCARTRSTSPPPSPSAAAPSARCTRTSPGPSATTASRCPSPPASSSPSGSSCVQRSARSRWPAPASSSRSTPSR